MRKLLVVLGVALFGVVGWAGVGWADPPTFNEDNVCVQGFPSPGPGATSSSDVPVELDKQCAPDNCVAHFADDLTTLNTLGKMFAEEIQRLFNNESITTKVFIIPKDPICHRRRILHSHVPLTGDIGWALWNDSLNRLYIGVSELAFDQKYTLAQHETAKLIELFWYPGGPKPKSKDYSPKIMPTFLSTDSPESHLYAAYEIIAHEVAHYWNRAYGGVGVGLYASSNSGVPVQSSPGIVCPTTCYQLNPGTFPTWSWINYVAEPVAYDPPWTLEGIWGNPKMTTFQETLKRYSVPLGGFGFQGWPIGNSSNSSDIGTFLDQLYSSGFPTAQAATSPVEDFAESYTMWALYRAGLRSLCLNVPMDNGVILNIPVMSQLFQDGSPFRKKIELLKSITAKLNGDNAIPPPADFPKTSACPP